MIGSYLATIPPSAAKSDGIKVGEEVAAKIVADRKGDGADAPDAVSAADEAWRLRADSHYGILDVAECEAVHLAGGTHARHPASRPAVLRIPIPLDYAVTRGS